MRARQAALAAVLLVLAYGARMAQGAEPCPFDHQNLTFIGEPITQARCLLRQVRAFGELGAPLAALPAPLEQLIGQPASFTVAVLRGYLLEHAISEADIGGSLERPVSLAKAGDATAPRARYLVIHDTSSPRFGSAEFPEDIDRATWPENSLDHWLEGERSRAHVFVSRVGGSVTAVDFAEPWRATKFEMQDTLLRRKGLFLHIELVQPRRTAAAGPRPNEALPPTPGFTLQQYARLALVYAAASVRRGEWLIPTFHAVLDAGRVDAHDDPQNFSLDRFAAALTALLSELPGRDAAAVGKPVRGLAYGRLAVASPLIPE